VIRRTARRTVAIAVLAAGAACAAASTTPAGRGTGGFDSGRAFEHIRQLVALGPRPAGSPAAQQARRYIRDQARSFGVTATEQPFVASTPLGPVAMANVILTLPGTSADRIVIGGHYDTKLFREFRFVGANDGGSSAAMLLELARVLKERPRPFTLEFVFFDGEEAVVNWFSGSDHTYGSRHYVEQARKGGTLKGVRAMLLVDMVADPDLGFRREARSTRWLTDALWASAKRLGYADHFLEQSETVDDDHVSFLNAGVPAVDLIDLHYRQWHTADDTLENVSARSLQIVGDVILGALPAIEKRLSTGRE
jgi:Zn-dependent M28 family amino/carboxypeptidase